MADSAEAEFTELANLAEERDKKVQSILNVLRSPNASNFARKRKISVNSGGNRRSVATKMKSAYQPNVFCQAAS